MHGPGTVLAGRYRLDERVGAGGMGEVWRATDQELGRLVAVKVVHAALLADPGFVTRFRAEARMMASINHPGVVTVHDYQDDPAGAFLVMDYVVGEPLSRLLARVGRLPAVRTMELMAQAADALHAAHTNGVVHRDVKPANLLVRSDGGVVLTDFGIARSQAGTQLTATGAVVGTPSYLAPEQVTGEPANPRTDVYALGVLAYECLTGRRPFDRENPFATAMARVREAPPTLVADVPPGVAAVVERAMATDPAHRWASAADLATACRRAAIAPYSPPAPPYSPPAPPYSPPAPPYSPPAPPYGGVVPPPARPRRRGLALAIAGGAAGVAVLVTGLVVAVVTVANLAGGDEPGRPSATAGPLGPECAAFAAFQGNAGTTVSILGALTGIDTDLLSQSWEPFTDCTGIAIEYEGAAEFEPLLQTMVAAGDPPDLAFLQRPTQLVEWAEQGPLVPAPAELVDQAESWSPAYRDLMTVDGTHYGAPLGIQLHSLVWYSPTYFADNRYQVPQTWDDLLDLSDTIAATGVKPWCAGIESDTATGWPVAFWVADTLLRLHGPAVYEQWWRHEIPFDDPRVVEAIDLAGGILKNPDYVNGGLGDVASIATSNYQEAGFPILDDECAMHRQGTFYANLWPSGTEIGENGDVWAFYLPPVDASTGRPVVGNGELVAAFDDRPEVAAVQTHLASTDWAAARTALGGFVAANLDVDPADAPEPIDRLAMEILQAPEADVYFGPLELMPPDVLSPFWGEMTAWINGQDSQTTAAAIEDSWP